MVTLILLSDFLNLPYPCTPGIVSVSNAIIVMGSGVAFPAYLMANESDTKEDENLETKEASAANNRSLISYISWEAYSRTVSKKL